MFILLTDVYVLAMYDKMIKSCNNICFVNWLRGVRRFNVIFI